MTPERRVLTQEHILRDALAREQASHAFYAGTARNCATGVVADLLNRLANEEYEHIRMIEGMMARLRMGHDVV